jgi:outer membrane protein assembly factor BamB
VNGLIFTAPGALQKDFICLRASDGKILWRTPSQGLTVQTPTGPANKLPAFSYSSPAVAGDRVYTAATNGIFYALNTADGGIQWKYNTEGQATYYAPTVAGRYVICVPGEYNPKVYAVDRNTGIEAWSFTAQGKAFYTSSAAATKDTVFIGSGTPDQILYALDASNGKERWRFSTGYSTSQNFASSPAIAGGLVIVGAGPETPESEMIGRVFALDISTGARLWSANLPKPVAASPSISGHRVFVGATDGVLYAYRDATSDSRSPKTKPPAPPTRPKTPSAKSTGAKTIKTGTKTAKK